MIDQLTTLIQSRDETALMELIEKNPKILDTTDSNGSSGFQLLAYSGLHDVFTHAIRCKQSFSFHEAIIGGQQSIVQESLTDPDLMNRYSTDGFTPIALAAFFGQTDIAILLLERGADPGLHATNPAKVNALHAAVAKGDMKLCTRFIQSGMNVNSTQMQGVTALHSAAHRGNLELVRLLVEAGADPELKMDNGDTPLAIAQRENNTAIVDFLQAKSRMNQ